MDSDARLTLLPRGSGGPLLDLLAARPQPGPAPARSN
jgi:hypothetical protein